MSKERPNFSRLKPEAPPRRPGGGVRELSGAAIAEGHQAGGRARAQGGLAYVA
jgi:hypothetical protein